jgi:hypothetical protein
MLTESIVILLARGVLGLFLSAILAAAAYLLSLDIALSVWKISFSYDLMGILSTCIGAGVGGCLAWFDRDAPLRVMLLNLAVALAAAALGAWLGLQQGKDVFQLGGTLGIPALRGIILGAVLGANLPLIALAALKQVRNPRV